MSTCTTLLLALLSFQQVTLDDAVVHFNLNHLGVLKVKGTFDQVDGSFENVSQNKWGIQGQVKVQSINTGNASRDETVLTEQYFNASSFPYILFKANLFVEDNVLKMILDLRIRDVDFQLQTELENVDGELVSKPLRFSRSEIGLDFGMMDTLIGDEVEIMISSGIQYQTIFELLKN